MENGLSEYAMAGVDYSKIDPFKRIMQGMGKRTLHFPKKRGVYVHACDHGAKFVCTMPQTMGGDITLMNVLEGLGNKNWIAEWMYANAGTGLTYYDGIGEDTAYMAVNDLISEFAMPVVYADEVAAGDSEWFADERRATALAESFFRACETAGMALAAGESPALKYLVNARLPVLSAPSLSGSVTGIISPTTRPIIPGSIKHGTNIIGVESSGIHANGISLLIKRAMELSDAFLTGVPDGKTTGKTLGEEALVPTMSYVALMEALSHEQIEIHALLPGTGGGVSKIAFDRRPFTYWISEWPAEIPPIFWFIQDLGVPLADCLTTFNWGIGYYIFAPKGSVETIMKIGRRLKYRMHHLGWVYEGERQVVFGPENSMVLYPPND